MRRVHTVEQVRAAEDALRATLPDGALMRQAAEGVARRCALLLRESGGVYGARVVLLVGKGDNGGDALFAGASLARRGARVDALAASDAVHEAGLAAFRGAGGRVHAPDAADAVLRDADLVVDGLLGIGGTGGLREPAATLARAAAKSRARVVAVDLPSGVDADTGAVAGEAVRADVTVCPGVLKPGLVVTPGAARAGAVEVLDLGLEPFLPPASTQVLDADDVAHLLPRPGVESSKYARGVLGACAGSGTYTGAAVLSVGGGLVGGAGMVRAVSTAAPAQAVRDRWPEVVVTEVEHGDAAAVLAAGRVQAWAVGPGLGTDGEAARVVAALLATDLPVLVDADGVTVAARNPGELRDRDAPTLLTPHAGEFARLTGRDPDDTEADRLGAARDAAADLGVHVLLKGSATVVAAPDGQAFVNPTGTGWLGTAGSGDVLTGLAGSLLAQGLDPLHAGAVAAFLHGLAGRLAASGRTGGALPAAREPRVGPDGGRAGRPGDAPVTAYDLLDGLRDAVRACGGTLPA